MTAAEQREACLLYHGAWVELGFTKPDEEVVKAALRLYAAMVDPKPAFVRALALAATKADIGNTWHTDMKALCREALRLVDAPEVT